MKNYHILLLAALLSLSSCSTYSEWNRGATGAYVGAMFGSLIGDIVGGPHGSSVGALVGGATGAVAGVASAKAEQERREGNTPNRYNDEYANYSYDNDIYYGSGNDYSYVAPVAPSQQLTVTNIIFADQNNNRVLEGGETAYITFEIRNHGHRPVFNVAPVISCSNNRIKVSPTATIARIDAGRGMRYKAVVHAQGNVRSGIATFDIGFAQNRGIDHAKSFRINVRR